MKNLDDDALEDVARYFSALAVPIRLKILSALRDCERNVGELTQIAESTQANVSKHLAVLSQSGILAKSPRGTSVYYRFADARVYRLCDLVCGQIAERYAEQGKRQEIFLAASGAPAKRKRATRTLKRL